MDVKLHSLRGCFPTFLLVFYSRSAVSEDSFEEAVTGFQSYIKQLEGFELGVQSYNISLQCELGQVLTQDKKCGNDFGLYM